MEAKASSIVLSLAIVVFVTCVWRICYFVWVRPKKLERLLRKQGFKGNPYRLWYGDLKDIRRMTMQTLAKPISILDDIIPYVLPFHHHIIQKYGKNSFIWTGPSPRVMIMDPDMMKDILYKYNVYWKPVSNPLIRFLVTGVLFHEGQQWAKHRKILNPAFHLGKLKLMLPAMYSSCSEMVKKWEMIVAESGSGEVDVWSALGNLSADVISRTAFGSSYEEGKRIFQLQSEQALLTYKILQSFYIPGWRFLPTKTNKKMKEMHSEACSIMRGIINKREKAMADGDDKNDDLLGILMESNMKEIQENKNSKKFGMSIDDVIEECKLFYFAGQETTSNLLTWTMVMLSIHQDWQKRAREEVLQVLAGDEQPDFDMLNHLKIVNMILNEVLRLYPPATMLNRRTKETTKLGDITLPPGVDLFLPIILIHHDKEIWGDDAKEFKPERFSKGVAKAAKNPAAFFPFSTGPRVCIGQQFAMLETKMAIAMILRKFSFELSPSYEHAPFNVITMQPRCGAKIILHKI